MEKVILYKNLGIVSVAMDPKKPQTKFDSMLSESAPEGKIYQIAMFNKDDTKFKLLEDIVNGESRTNDVTIFTHFAKLNKENALITKNGEYDPRLLYSAKNTVSIDKVNLKGIPEASHVLEGLNHVPHDEDFYSLDFLVENNKRFVSVQVDYFNKEIEKRKNVEILSPEF